MNYFKKLPEELLLALFTYLDQETKLAVSRVCENWRNLIHHTSWKSISRLVEGDNTMKKEFSTFGWIETAEHEFGECRCIELHLGQHPFQNASLIKTHHDKILYDICEPLVFQQSKIIGVETCTEEGFVTFHEIDFDDLSPSWRKVKNIPKNIEGNYWDIRTSLTCCDKTLILLEEKNVNTISRAHITLWNTETWAFVCQLPLKETSIEILKKKYEVSEENIVVHFLSLEVSSEIIVANIVYAFGTDEDLKSLVLFWKHDALNPADPPTFHTYIFEEEKIKERCLHLNAKYFCKRNSHVLQVYALDDLKDNNNSKSRILVPTLGSFVYRSQLEGGKSNRLAVIFTDTDTADTEELKVYNIENGHCVFSLDFDELFHRFRVERNTSWNLYHSIKFHLGKLILIQPLQRCQSKPKRCRYQIFIIDEKAKDQVVVGASLDTEDDSIGRFYIGSKSMINWKRDNLNHWKIEQSNT